MGMVYDRKLEEIIFWVGYDNPCAMVMRPAGPVKNGAGSDSSRCGV